jgi:RES domain-containing protein
VTTFPSAHSYWHFAHSCRTKARYIQTSEGRRFLKAVLESAQDRVDVAPAGSFLWRAQRGASTIELPISGTNDVAEEDYPYDAARMKPLRDRARENRVNPKGIPYLYLATHRDTAAAEVRPWKGGVVSVGQFRLARDLKLVNATSDAERTFYFGEEPSPEERAEAVWLDIDHAFSAPTTTSDDAAEYVPTQILGELFRHHGYDGVAYRSSYGSGHNVALFDLDLAIQVNCFVVRVKDMSFIFEQEHHSYAVPESSATVTEHTPGGDKP